MHPFGASMRQVGAKMRRSGAKMRQADAKMRQSGAKMRYLGPSRRHLEPSWLHLGPPSKTCISSSNEICDGSHFVSSVLISSQRSHVFLLLFLAKCACLSEHESFYMIPPHEEQIPQTNTLRMGEPPPCSSIWRVLRKQ